MRGVLLQVIVLLNSLCVLLTSRRVRVVERIRERVVAAALARAERLIGAVVAVGGFTEGQRLAHVHVLLRALRTPERLLRLGRCLTERVVVGVLVGVIR